MKRIAETRFPAGLLFLAALLAGCAGSREKPPKWPAVLRGAALPMEIPLSSIARINFMPQYELFRDSGTPWGAGMAFGALWRHDLPDESVLKGVTIGGDGAVLVAEGRKDSFAQAVLRRLDASGRTVSTAAIEGDFDSLTAGDFGGHPALIAQGGYGLEILSPGGSPVWHPSQTLQKAVLADLEGDGRKALVAAAPDYQGVVAAFAANGRKLWTRAGFDHVEGLAAGRFGRDRADTIVVFGSVKGVSRVSLLDGKGRVRSSFSDDSVPERGAVMAADGAATFLVHVGSKYQTDHTRVKVSRLEARSRTAAAEADAGRAQTSSLLLADLRGDGRKEIVLGMDNGWVLIYDSDARFLAEKHFFGDIRYLAATGPDRDGRQELVVGVRSLSSEVYACGVVPNAAAKRER